jgi:uncharacterized protein YegL
MDKRPGGTMARRQLHFIWLLDTSGSMNADGKIQALNVAIRETIPHLQSVARENANVDVLVRAVTFSNGARWHVEEPTPVANLRWNDVTAVGHTDMGCALRLVADALKVPPMPERAVSPVLVLVTDGHHTDDVDGGIAALMGERWGREAVRLAIALGRDVSNETLQKFIGDDALRPLQANNPEGLLQHIQWASRSGIQSASQLVGSDQLGDELRAVQASQVAAAEEW